MTDRAWGEYGACSAALFPSDFTRPSAGKTKDPYVSPDSIEMDCVGQFGPARYPRYGH